jgi:flagellar assembly protein FliH
MTSLRIVRRLSHDVERVTLGMAAKAVSPSMTAEVQSSRERVAAIAATNESAEEHAREIGALRSRLESSEREREQLEAALASLRSEIESARENARKEGYRDGATKAQREVEREAERALSEQLAQWRTSTAEAAQGFESRIQSVRSELSEVVLAGVTKILGEHLVNPTSIRAMLEQVLREAGLTGPVRVLLAPSQFEQLTRMGAAQLASLRERKMEVAPDSRVAHGGCLVETPTGLVDGRFEVQLAKLREIVSSHYGAGSQGR